MASKPIKVRPKGPRDRAAEEARRRFAKMLDDVFRNAQSSPLCTDAERKVFAQVRKHVTAARRLLDIADMGDRRL